MKENRLTILIKALDVSKTDFAKSIGKTIENIRKYEVGTRSITKKFAMSVCEVYKNVNYDWLRNGTGEMFISAFCALNPVPVRDVFRSLAKVSVKL